MASNLAKAAVGALALNGGAENNVPENNVPEKSVPEEKVYPECPNPRLAHYHDYDVCKGPRRVRLPLGDVQRKSIYERLKDSGQGASMVPNQQTVTCPLEVHNLESSTAVKGLDTTWIVQNTGSLPVIVSWVVDGVEWSPFKPDMKAVDDPETLVQPGEWLNVPTFDSFVYHVREQTKDGGAGDIVLQHRVGLIPIGNPRQIDCDASLPDVEPVNPKTAERDPNFARKPHSDNRPCNIIDLSFRNQLGCPLHVYWANRLEDVPETGFNCGEQFRFHLGTNPAPQDFMNDWDSATKFEGTFIGHTFVARLASDPNIVVDSYTVEPTKIVDCPNRKQKAATKTHSEAEAVVTAEGTILPMEEEETVATEVAGASIAAGATAAGSSM